jgi:Ca2+-binding EF-hand superfamily protein
MLKDLWTSFDDDKSGKLDPKEVKQVLAAALADMSQRDLERAFAAMDADGSGEIDFYEFSQWCVRPSLALSVRVILTYPCIFCMDNH